MDCPRNRILKIVEYLKSLGIEVNIGKNKAQGNRGFFKVKNNQFRIDIAAKLDDDTILRTLIHEFAHFVHYNYDKSLQSLDFILGKENDILLEELIDLTVESIPKTTVQPIFEAKKRLQSELKSIEEKLIVLYPKFKLSKPCKEIEQKIKKTDFRYLLKYDKVKVYEGFCTKVYTLDAVQATEDIQLYLKLRSLQRAIRRVNSKISRLNKYYNSPTELFARSLEYYILDNAKFAIKSPHLAERFNTSSIQMIEDLYKIVFTNC